MSDPSPQEQAQRSRLRGGAVGGPPRSFDVLAGAQTVGALLFGILLFAVPLYLWRRPHSAQVPIHAESALSEVTSRDGGPPPLAVSVEAVRPPAVKLAEARVLECHDRGARRTPADQCDHIAAFEQALDDAIAATHECVPPDAGAGSIQFVADLSFGRLRHPVTLALPRDGRSYRSSKIVKDCAAGVRARMSSLPVTTFQHAHGRYKISVVATYGGSPS